MEWVCGVSFVKGERGWGRGGCVPLGLLVLARALGAVRRDWASVGGAGLLSPESEIRRCCGGLWYGRRG